MDGAVSAQEPQIRTADPVGHRRTGTVCDAEHISIPAHVGSDIALPEFNQQILLFLPQSLPHAGHKHVQRLLDISVIHSLLPHRSALSYIKLIDKIQLQPI